MSKVNSPEYMELHSCFHQTLINEIIVCQIPEPKIKESLRTRGLKVRVTLTDDNESAFRPASRERNKTPTTRSNNSQALSEPAGGGRRLTDCRRHSRPAANARSSQETPASCSMHGRTRFII